MKSEILEPEVIETFPCMKIYRGSNMVVLFACPTQGTVISGAFGPFFLGEYKPDWAGIFDPLEPGTKVVLTA